MYSIMKKIFLRLKNIMSHLFMKKMNEISYEEANLKLDDYYKDVHSTCIIPCNIFKTIQKKLLTIIVANYNNETSLKFCIDSIINQKTKYKYELIIVNDGSTDNSMSVLKQYECFSFIKIINQKNKGLSGARNTGLDYSNGEYVMFVDSDDILLDNAIEILMNVMVEKNADIVQGNLEKIESYDKKQFACNKTIVDKVVPLGIFEGFACGKIYRKELFNTIRFPLGYYYEDSLNAQIIFSLANNCYKLSNKVYGYYQNNFGITKTSLKSPKALDSLYITRQLLKDRSQIELMFTQDNYEYFLRNIILTYRRTINLNVNIKYYIFVVWRKLIEEYFNDFSTVKGRKMKLFEKSLRNNKFKEYLFCLDVLN